MGHPKISPYFGYYPNGKKGWIISRPDREIIVKEAFKETAINVTVQGQRHVGAAIRSQEYDEEYVNDKVTNWISTITKLAEFNATQPQASYVAYTFGLNIDGPISRELCQKSKNYLNHFKAEYLAFSSLSLQIRGVANWTETYWYFQSVWEDCKLRLSKPF